MTGAGPIMRIRGLSVESAAGQRLLSDADLEVGRGELVGLVGASGAGKTTLGLAALGHVRRGCRIVGGQILLGDEDLAVASPRRLRELRRTRLTYVAQSAASAFNPAHQLMPQIVEGAVRYGLTSCTEAVREALHLLERFDVPDPVTFGARYPHQVSGGQLQRAMIAMAMLCQPDIVVFDEPTTALDVATQAEVLAVIGEAVSMTGASGIYISHDLELVARVVDRVSVVDGGRVVRSGPTAQALAAIARDQTGATLDADDGPANATCDAILALDGIVAGYSATPVLHGVSVSVPAGGAVGLVGRSGSGKSSIARVVTGLLPPTAGTIAFEGRRLDPRWSKRARSDLAAIQLVYQSPDTALNPSQTVERIISRPLEIAGGLSKDARQERVRELLDVMGLPPAEFLGRRPGTLSGGQKQRVAIARALASEPRLLVCDEITSALDADAADLVIDRLAELRRTHSISLLFISHELAMVRAICDQVVVLESGRVVEAGPTDQVFTNPQSVVTRHLIDADLRYGTVSSTTREVPVQ